MIPVVLGLGGLIAKVAAAAVVPRAVKALVAILSGPAQPDARRPGPDLVEPFPPSTTMTAPQRVTETGLIRKQAIAHNSDYGETTQTSGSPSVYNPFLYTGQELDKETGFYYLRARHYAPSLGKFLSRDPIGYGGGSNLYSYTPDPINFSDPNGLQPVGSPSWKAQRQADYNQRVQAIRWANEWYEGILAGEVAGRVIGEVLGAVSSKFRGLKRGQKPCPPVVKVKGHVGAAGADEFYHAGNVFSREEILHGGEVIARGRAGGRINGVAVPGIREIDDILTVYPGTKAKDWQKVSNIMSGTNVDTNVVTDAMRKHYYRNTETGAIYKFKDKILEPGQW